MDELDLNVVDRLLSTTRAVRRRMDFSRPVEKAVIQECIRLATFAPNARNEQDWRWIVVTDPAQREAIARTLAAPGGAAGRQTGRPVDEAIRRSSGYLAQHLADVPALVFASIIGTVPAGASARVLGDFLGSIIPAVWSFQLAARARGLGSVFTTSFLRHEPEIRELLGVPSDVTMVAMIPVAYYTGTLTPPPRRPVAEVLYWDGWQAESGSAEDALAGSGGER